MQALDDLYRLRVAASRVETAARAKTAWGTARTKLHVGAATKGLALRESLLATIVNPPKPYTQNPNLGTLNPTPYTLNPTP